MRQARTSTLLALAVALASQAQAADIVNGWSPVARITSIYSLGALTMFKLSSGNTLTCGHPDYWQLPLNDTTTSKNKNAQLLAAFVAGKQVSLRCENSLVSDFQIFE
jgi:hypothetical protein